MPDFVPPRPIPSPASPSSLQDSGCELSSAYLHQSLHSFSPFPLVSVFILVHCLLLTMECQFLLFWRAFPGVGRRAQIFILPMKVMNALPMP